MRQIAKGLDPASADDFCPNFVHANDCLYGEPTAFNCFQVLAQLLYFQFLNKLARGVIPVLRHPLFVGQFEV